MKNIIIFLFLFTISFISGQIAPPPPPARPFSDNKILVEELIKVTDYEKYVYDYCIDKITKASQENNWDYMKKQEVIKSVDFNQFRETIYNTLAVYSKEELQDLIKLFKKLDHRIRNIRLVPITASIQSNLEDFTAEIIKGNYIDLNN